MEQNGKKNILKKQNKSVSFSLIEVIIIVIITSLVVAVSTGVIVYKNYEKTSVKVNKDSNVEEFINAYNNILNSYVEEVDEKVLIDAAIEGMFNKLEDKYTSYLDQSTTSNLQDQLEGEYIGIGVEIGKLVDETIIIVNVFEGSSAKKGGLVPGDILLSVNGYSVKEKSTDEVSNIIRSSETVTIEYKNINGEVKTVVLDVVNTVIPSVAKNNFNGVGYIKVSTFSNTTYSQFIDALKALEEENITSLVIDLRNNTGGYLKSASDIAELFLEKDKVVYGIEGKDNKIQLKLDTTKERRNYKMSVLINQNTASASEILAAALKESANAKLVGTTSYGKGTIQETSKLSSGSMIKYTTGYWLTPNKERIEGKGLTPDVVINLDDISIYSYESDNQLQKAIEIVK